MIFAKYIPWETLQKMKKLLTAHLVVGTVGTGSFILYDTLLIDKNREFVECLEHGFPAPLKPDLKGVFEEVLNDLKLEEKEKEKLTPFKLAASRLYHCGYPIYKTIIGLPPYFEFDDPYDVPRSLMCWGNPVDVDSPVGMQYREASVVTKNEKKFAIAREILESRSRNNYIFAALPISFSIMSFYLQHYLVTTFKTQLEHTPFRKKGFYALFYCTTFLFYVTFKDALTSNIECEADLKTSEIGLEDGKPTELTFDYINGGIGYYDKILKRNKINREHYMPVYAKWMLTDDGDRSQYFRSKHVPYLDRKNRLEHMLYNYEKHGVLHDSEVFWNSWTKRQKDMEEREEKLFGKSSLAANLAQNKENS